MVYVKRVIALGFFDGVHIGHGALLNVASRRAAELSARATTLTFDHHPGSMLTGTPVPLINSTQDRQALMQRVYDIDEVLIGHFDNEMRNMPWEEFITDYLIGRYGAVHLVAGHDFHFGYRGMGTPELLVSKCAELGIGCDIIPKITIGDVTVSSTVIREMLQAGEIESANSFLGHPHCMTGLVVKGQGLGRTIGVPTANITIPDGVVIPKFGVYACKVETAHRQYMAVTNVGVRPTVNNSGLVTVEPFMLDFEEDLYGKPIRVDFYKFLRPEMRFSSVEELRAEISRNARQTREFFESDYAIPRPSEFGIAAQL